MTILNAFSSVFIPSWLNHWKNQSPAIKQSDFYQITQLQQSSLASLAEAMAQKVRGEVTNFDDKIESKDRTEIDKQRVVERLEKAILERIKEGAEKNPVRASVVGYEFELSTADQKPAGPLQEALTAMDADTARYALAKKIVIRVEPLVCEDWYFNTRDYGPLKHWMVTVVAGSRTASSQIQI